MIHIHISTPDNICTIFANGKGKLVIIWKNKCPVSPELPNQACSLSPSHSRSLGWDIVRMPLGEAGGAQCLPAVRGRRREQQRQQLSGRDREPTAPSRRAQRTSLVLGEVCGWCCLICLKMTASSHLKQGQRCMVSCLPKMSGHGQPGASLIEGSAQCPTVCTPIPPPASTPSPQNLTSCPFGSGIKHGYFHLFHG